MSTKKIATKRRRLEAIARDVEKEMNSGHDVVLRFERSVPPRRILDTINILIGEYEIDLVIRHAEFRDYVVNAAEGAAAGAAVGVAARVVAALIAGNPVTLPAVLAATGIGALVGLILGAGLTKVHLLTVYKYKGGTHIRLSQAA